MVSEGIPLRMFPFRAVACICVFCVVSPQCNVTGDREFVFSTGSLVANGTVTVEDVRLPRTKELAFSVVDGGTSFSNVYFNRVTNSTTTFELRMNATSPAAWLAGQPP